MSKPQADGSEQVPAGSPSSSAPSSPTPDVAQLDALTGGVFTAPTSGERAARLRDWLATQPSHDWMLEVFRELSHRDKGAAKPLKEKLDEIKRSKAQDAVAAEWAERAQALLAQPRLNLADAMGWQRDAAKAGAPLSREPLAGLKAALAERMKALEDLQHKVQVEREAAVLLAQRIEVLSTKPWQEAQAALASLKADVDHWQQRAAQLPADAAWDALEPRYATQLQGSGQQLSVVWEAFEAALAQAALAATDATAPLPAVPVWADALRTLRGESSVAPAAEEASTAHAAHAAHAGSGATAAPAETPERAARRAKAVETVSAALAALRQEVDAGHAKAFPKAIADLRATLKEHGRWVDAALEALVHGTLIEAGELEGWQRWRADQLREELVAKAVALTQAPEGQQLGGRKMQEALRSLRDQWKAIDQGGAPNHALWKKFDEACNQAYAVVETWLSRLKEQNESSRAQRMALIDEVKAWTLAHETDTDWKGQIRELHAFSERWRQSGHLSDKLFTELQPLWKQAMHTAHVRLEAVQAESTALRQAMIEEARTLGAAPSLRIDEVKALQQRWQQEAHRVPLERKHEQRLWEAFRKPIDEAFERKSAEREKATAELSAHDRVVLEAAKALEAASASGDAGRIRAAMQALQSALRGEATEPSPAAPSAQDSAEAQAAPVPSPSPSPTPAPAAPPRKVVAVRGDDRPGMVRAVAAAPGKGPQGRPGPGGRPERGERGGRDDRSDRGDSFARGPRPPRLGDAAFRLQRDALERAETALRKLAAQAHGEVVTQLLAAWEKRHADSVPTAQALGGRAAQARPQWVRALQGPDAKTDPNSVGPSLLRLEMAAEVPTPADFMEARRMLQLQLLTSRNAPAPAQTWPEDVATVLGAAHTPEAARRLQQALKALLRR
jgi:ATP-dependent RNA helicase SUPV3L1/SUV3